MNPDEERYELLAALQAVDFVTPLVEDTPVELLEALVKPRDTEAAQSIPNELGCLNGSTRALVGEADVVAEAV